jgi:hypothetical protein
MALPFPDAPPNFLATFIQARRAGQEDRLATERQNALSMIGTNPQKARSALMGVGDFQAVGAIDRDQERTTRRDVLSQYGKDPGAARTAAFEAGDPALIEAISGLDEQQRAAADARAKRLGAIAYKLKSQPYEARKQAIQQLTPALAQEFGFPPEALAAFDPTDATLDTIVSQALSLSELMKQAEGFTLSPGQRRFDASGREIAAVGEKPEYKTVREGETLVQVGGGGGSPRGLRNNNPGNIEDGPFARSLPGYKGSDGRFAIFDTPEAGQAAQVRLLQSYGSRGINTVQGIINRWAPPSDNNPTPTYVNFVAQQVGVSPDQPLDMNDPATLQKVASAITAFENGGQSASNGGARVVAQGSPKQQDRWEQISPQQQRNTRTNEVKGIPNAPPDRSRQNAEAAMKAKMIMQTVDDALKNVNAWTAGFVGGSTRGIPGTPPYDLARQVETIRANLGFQELQAMREASPTGGALGQVAVQELIALQSTVANLDTAQSPKQLRANLNKVKQHYQRWLSTVERAGGGGGGGGAPDPLGIR